MKKDDLPISRLSRAQELDLCQGEANLKSPLWHEGVLKDREAAFEAGRITASDWEQAKRMIKKRVS